MTFSHKVLSGVPILQVSTVYQRQFFGRDSQESVQDMLTEMDFDVYVSCKHHSLPPNQLFDQYNGVSKILIWFFQCPWIYPNYLPEFAEERRTAIIQEPHSFSLIKRPLHSLKSLLCFPNNLVAELELFRCLGHPFRTYDNISCNVGSAEVAAIKCS